MMRIKRVILSLFAAVLVTIALQGPGWAHPPKDIQLTYRPADGVLVVTVLHGVKNPQKHYIEKVIVSVGGQKIAEENFSEQTSKQSLVVTIPVGPLPKGTEVRVEAKCVIFGTARATLIIP